MKINYFITSLTQYVPYWPKSKANTKQHPQKDREQHRLANVHTFEFDAITKSKNPTKQNSRIKPTQGITKI